MQRKRPIGSSGPPYDLQCHMAWVRNIGGRLKSDFSVFGIGIVYNTFPLPPVPAERLERLAPPSEAVLASLAPTIQAKRWLNLYDPDFMPP